MASRHPVLHALLLTGTGSLLMYLGTLVLLSGSLGDGQYVPSNADAFYHARRILDAVMGGGAVIQFDPRMHVPEGSWITWPWGFDQALASLVSLFGPFASEADAAGVLAHVPLAFIPVAIGLMVLLTRQLDLSLPMRALVVLAYALIPLDFARFAVGNVDHHFAEQLWALMLLNGAMWLVRRPADAAPPIVVGCLLGCGVAVQNGLFLLPVLLVLALLVAWFRGLELPPRARLDAVAVSLLASTLAVCIPSQPWRDGSFDFYLLSWFHVYVTAVCAGFLVWIARARPSLRVAFWMLAAGMVAVLPVLAQVVYGLRFAGGELQLIEHIAEARSPYWLYFQLGPQYSTRLFTWLMWLAMPALLVNLWWASRSRQAPLVVFAVIGCIVLALMQAQLRFSVLGMASLLATPALLVEQLAQRRPAVASMGRLLLALLFVLCLLPARGFFTARWVAGDDLSYVALRGELRALGNSCRAAPGVVLASKDAGHWIRYHTDCAVIANVFLLTPQHARKVQEVEELMALEPAVLRARRPDVRYVLAYIDVDRAIRSGINQPTQPQVEAALANEPLLVRELLGSGHPVPDGFREISAAASPKGGIYAKVFEVSPPRSEP